MCQRAMRRLLPVLLKESARDAVDLVAHQPRGAKINLNQLGQHRTRQLQLGLRLKDRARNGLDRHLSLQLL